MQPALDDVAQNADVMADAAGHHKQMPDAVKVADALIQYKEADAAGVTETAGQQPPEPLRGQRGIERLLIGCKTTAIGSIQIAMTPAILRSAPMRRPLSFMG